MRDKAKKVCWGEERWQKCLWCYTKESGLGPVTHEQP